MQYLCATLGELLVAYLLFRLMEDASFRQGACGIRKSQGLIGFRCLSVNSPKYTSIQSVLINLCSLLIPFIPDEEVTP